MALPIRTQPPKRRGLTLVHSRTTSSGKSSTIESFAVEPSSANSDAVDVELDTPASEPPVSRPLRRDVDLPSSSRARHPEEDSDARLVALCRVGDSTAFEALYRRYAPYALALAVRVQGNAGDVEDIVHDAFLKVYDRLSDLRDQSSFRPWLAAIVVSLVRTKLRRRRMLSVLGLMQSEPVDLDAIVTGEAGPEVRAQLAQVYSLLAEVTVDQRICWTLRYLEGRRLEDVAHIAGCSLATAKRRIAAVQQRITQLESDSSVRNEAGIELNRTEEDS